MRNINEKINMKLGNILNKVANIDSEYIIHI